MYKITLVNRKTRKTIHEPSVEDVPHQMWGTDVTDITILIEVAGKVEMFDWDSVFCGKGVDVQVLEEALHSKIKGMEYKYGN